MILPPQNWPRAEQHKDRQWHINDAFYKMAAANAKAETPTVCKEVARAAMNVLTMAGLSILVFIVLILTLLEMAGTA